MHPVVAGLVAAFLIAGSARAEVPPGAADLIARFHMTPIPAEGGWFAQVLRSTETIAGPALAPRYGGVAHPFSTAILYVETKAGFSALHRLKTDEVWHFYGGDPVRLLLLFPDGRGRDIVLDAASPAFVVPRDVWQGSSPAGPRGWSFVGTTMAPGFIPQDFQAGDRGSLDRAYPAFRGRIAELTRQGPFVP